MGLWRRLGSWGAVLVGVAFLAFGLQTRTVLFAACVLAATVWLGLRARAEVIAPLEELDEAVREAARGGRALPSIVRGGPEVRRLSEGLEEWAASANARLRELTEARSRLESVLRAMAEGVLVFDAESRIILANDAIRGLLAVPREVQGRTCLEVFRNESLDIAVRRVLGGRAAGAVEFRTGSGRAARALVAPVAGQPEGRVEAVVAVLQDLTDLRHIDQVRRDFVANVSHEFKTPLTSIRGYAETLMTAHLPEPERGFAEVVHRNARFLESLVDDLLALARLEGEPPSSAGPVDLGALVDEQVALRRGLPEAGHLSIVVDCPPLELRADRARLAMAVGNLIDNAIRYNRPGGEVRITGRRSGPHVLLSVADTGYGIPAAELPRVFERFYRIDRARTRAGGGTGLGLAIARHAVESQGGVLTAESRVGAGSTFTIRLPAA